MNLGRTSIAHTLDAASRVARLGAWRWDAATRWHAWSPWMCEMFDVPLIPDGFTDEDLLAVVDLPNRDELGAALAGLGDGTGEVSLSFAVVGRDGMIRQCRCAGERVISAGGQTVAVEGYCQDVTALRQAELVRCHAERLAAISQVTGGLAHDFNNLLTVISLNLEILVDMLEETDPAQEMLRPALKATTSASDLTDKMLAFARRRPLRPAPHDVNALLRDIVGRLAPGLPPGQSLGLVLQDNVGACLIDAAGFETALGHLVLNSSQALRDGGTITVRSELLVRSEPHVVIAVEDSGPGIPADLRGRVLEPFFTTRKGVRGSGLGLNLVQSFADQSGGWMVLDSEVGQGTVVRLFLPVHAG